MARGTQVAVRCEQLARFLPWIILAALAWTAACVAPLDSWAQPRLASAYALARGQELYLDLHSGAQLCWLYGPGFAVWMLPITLIPSLAWAEAVAVIANALALLGALLWCLRPDTPDWRTALDRTGWTGLIVCSASLTAGWFGGLHVDPLCIAFMLVALGAARRHLHSGATRWLHLSALAVALAVWTKQTAAVFPVVLVVGWGWERRWSLVFRWGGLTFGYTAVLSLLVGGVFGFGRIWFYIVAIHQRLPWRAADGYFSLTGDTLWLDLLPWAALAALPWAVRRLKSFPPSPDSASPYAWLGLAMLPFGVAAALKEGGGFNSAHGLFFAAVAIGLRLHAVASFGPVRLAAVLLLGVLALGNNSGRLGQWTPSPYQDRLLAIAQAQRGRLYLPWNPLITLVSDGKVYPFEYALYAREITDSALTPSEIRNALPEDPVILYDPLAATRTITRYLPEARPVTLHAHLATSQGAIAR